MKRFYITTPIYYINAEPSVGSACTTVVADVVARLRRQLGEEVFYLTGTDEHGEKVAQEATKAQLTPIQFCDLIAPTFIQAWKLLNISHDFFIRTTDPRHKKNVSEFLQKIFDKGDIYKDKYEGWYYSGCEAFKTEKELVDKHCPLHPPEKTVWKSEDNWFFKLSKYVPKIIKLLENDESNYIFPESKRVEVLAKLKAGVNDISVSRENVTWGIPAPWDISQTIYVWIDALINYYSATQFLENKKEFWPADMHLLGKEILWFHAVIWQAILMSAELPLPKTIYVHDFYTIDGQKMSKSLGNTIPPKEMVDLFGADGARYLITTSFPDDGDVDIGIERFKEKYNADLANNLGNLLSRVCKLGEGLNVPEILVDKENFIKLVNQLKLSEAVGWVLENFVNKSNNLLNQVEPWKLSADDPKRVEVLTEYASNLLKAADCLEPVIPEAANKIKEQLSGKIKALETALFPRIK